MHKTKFTNVYFLVVGLKKASEFKLVVSLHVKTFVAISTPSHHFRSLRYTPIDWLDSLSLFHLSKLVALSRGERTWVMCSCCSMSMFGQWQRLPKSTIMAITTNGQVDTQKIIKLAKRFLFKFSLLTSNQITNQTVEKL